MPKAFPLVKNLPETFLVPNKGLINFVPPIMEVQKFYLPIIPPISQLPILFLGHYRPIGTVIPGLLRVYEWTQPVTSTIIYVILIVMISQSHK